MSETETPSGYHGRNEPSGITKRQEKRHVPGESRESLGSKDEMTWASVPLVGGITLMK